MFTGILASIFRILGQKLTFLKYWKYFLQFLKKNICTNISLILQKILEEFLDGFLEEMFDKFLKRLLIKLFEEFPKLFVEKFLVRFLEEFHKRFLDEFQKIFLIIYLEECLKVLM